ncbi:SgcJ/EcaC family oxidoreductase [Nocardia sp. NBC_00565]|uniref:SgcJ/EcaC family oxidoreductase n=1 Tax=Nocardia sp. NBC_00565 TaxID=2975993 RepID=UPI002E81B5F7|nr:SgcJ/EcaC family oxidoreductase [Nocardia sp. NBC_00565]WUC01733.1 SgcJ/EcaC family oxidoreductase [Nocardia sp. NBC_00565]
MNTTEAKEIHGVLAELIEAWGRGDADAYGAVFTEDATYTSFLGTLYRGRADIVTSHRALFGGVLKGTRLADDIVDLRFYGPDTAVVNSHGDTYKGKSKRADQLTKTQTYTLVRREGHWLIAAFQNTKRNRLMERITYLSAPEARPAAER